MLGLDGDINGLIEVLTKDQARVVNSLGNLDYRVKIFEAITCWVKPVPESRLLVSRNALMRIGYTLLPEIQGGEEEHKTLIDKFVEILNGDQNSE